MRKMALALLTMFLPVLSFGALPSYLTTQLTLPQDAVQGLLTKAQQLGIPTLSYTERGPVLYGVQSESELLSSERYLIYDPPYFLLSVQTDSSLAVLRGDGSRAELISLGKGGNLALPPQELLELLDQLGLLPSGQTVELRAVDLPLKLPAVPEGVKLDAELWGLIGYPDWLGFARDHGLELKGIRVHVVVERTAALPEKYEPYIISSSDGLVEMFLPIPLLSELGRDPAVKLVRPPHMPHPAAGAEG